MATSACTVNASCDYNGGWDSSYGTGGGYASSSPKRCTVFKFTTGSFSGTYSNTISSLSGKIKIRTAGNTAGKGVVVMKIFSSDPRGGSFPTLTGGSRTTVSWSRSGANFSDFSYSISSPSLSAKTTYYMVVGYSSGDNAEISGSGGFSATVTYTAINSVGKPSKPAAPSDNFDNTFTASCSAVSNPTGNSVDTTIQYRFGSNGSWNDAGARTITRAHTAEVAADTQTVYARIKADPEYGTTQYSDESAGTAIKNYVAPAQPTEAPSVSKTKSRFTVKEPWVVSWSKTTQQAGKKNNSSPVAGYRIVMLVKRGGTGGWVSEPFKVKANNSQGWSYLGQNPGNKGNGDAWYTVDTSDLDSMTEITIDPMVQGFVPGDVVKVGIRPYILYGAANPSDGGSLSDNCKLWTSESSINGTDGVDNKTYTFTEDITVQNAGIVRVKTGTDKSSFKEGIVWVKVSNTGTKTTDWVEADVVKVKTSSGWKESE